MDDSHPLIPDQSPPKGSENLTAMTYGVFGFIAGIIATLLFLLVTGSLWRWGGMPGRMPASPNQMMNPPVEQPSPSPGEG
jgi:hypothetical protein